MRTIAKALGVAAMATSLVAIARGAGADIAGRRRHRVHADGRPSGRAAGAAAHHGAKARGRGARREADRAVFELDRPKTMLAQFREALAAKPDAS